MAKMKRGPETIGGYFRQLFTEHQDLLKLRTNPEIQALWEKDHPNERMTERIKNNMSNVKSQMRKKFRKGGRKAKASQSTLIAIHPANSRRPNLVGLEVAIDDCMMMAKVINREALNQVLEHLRRARNLVVYQGGEKQ